MIGFLLLISWIITWMFFFHDRTTSVEVREVERFRHSSYLVLVLLLVWSIFAWIYTRVGITQIEIALSAALTVCGQILMVEARHRLPLSNHDLFYKVSTATTRGGVYAWVGHPMYIGLVAALVGSSLLLMNIPALYMAVFVIAPALWFRTRLERTA